jgi:hypothetical protein
MEPTKFALKVCCAGLSYATSNGSDNESHGKAIYFNNETGKSSMGSVEATVTHCPFCGKKIKFTKVKK